MKNFLHIFLVNTSIIGGVKKVLAFPVVWLFYIIGDITSKLSYKLELDFLYDIYNWFMIKSSDIQDWAKLKQPWKTIN